MIKIISKKASLKIFYYLMALDGVLECELEKFDQLGMEVLGEEYRGMKDEIIQECNQQIYGIPDTENNYDIISENVDQCLNDTVGDLSRGLVPRMLIWNMLTLAHSDNDFSRDEDRLISHVVRMLQIDQSVYAEMKLLITTAEAVQKQKDLLEISNRPYAEIKPLIDQVENRRLTIIEAAKALIEDEMIYDIPEQEVQGKGTILDKGKKIGESVAAGGIKFGKKVAPTAKDVGEKASRGLKNTRSFLDEKVSKGKPNIKNGVGKLFKK